MAARKAFPLRINPRLYRELQRWAEDELRSVNGQIEYLITAALRREGRWPPKAGGEEAASPAKGSED